MNRRDFLRVGGTAGLAFLANTPFAMALPIAREPALIPVERLYVLMGTTARFLVYHEDRDEALAAIREAHAIMQRVHELMSVQDPSSDLSQWNASSTGLCYELHPLTVGALGEAIRHVEFTNGRFDPTVGYAVDAPHSSRRPILQKDRIGQWIPEQGQFEKVHDQVRLDLGGSAKGWAVDRAADVLLKRGMQAALINAGGDLRVIGHPPGQVHWNIGLRNPQCPERLICEINLTNASVATSGSGGSSTIVDPRDGAPVTEKGTVTVIAPTCGAADCLSTACTVEWDPAILSADAHAIFARQEGASLSFSENFPADLLATSSTPYHDDSCG